MGFHQKAASCSAIPSFNSLTSMSTVSSTSDHEYKVNKKSQQQHQQQQQQQQHQAKHASVSTLFPLPSFCLYSKRALVNEYAPESDIIQFLSPSSPILEERLPMFVGVLQSLFTVVNDMPFYKEEKDDDDEDDHDTEAEEEENDDEEEEQDKNNDNDSKAKSPFTIIGLSTMKLVIWNSMCDHVVNDEIYTKDLCLVIFLSSQLSDTSILNNMGLIKESMITENEAIACNVTANQIGDQLIPLVKYWFEGGN